MYIIMLMLSYVRSMKSDRLTLLMAPRDKRAIAAKAKRAGVSASEYVRRAVLAYDRIDEIDAPQDLVDLVKELVRVTERTEKNLDRALSRADELQEFLGREDERRAEVRRELEESGADWRGLPTVPYPAKAPGKKA